MVPDRSEENRVKYSRDVWNTADGVWNMSEGAWDSTEDLCAGGLIRATDGSCPRYDDEEE